MLKIGDCVRATCVHGQIGTVTGIVIGKVHENAVSVLTQRGTFTCAADTAETVLENELDAWTRRTAEEYRSRT